MEKKPEADRHVHEWSRPFLLSWVPVQTSLGREFYRLNEFAEYEEPRLFKTCATWEESGRLGMDGAQQILGLFVA